MDLGGFREAGRGAHWHNRASAIEPFVCGSDAAFFQITFTTFLLVFEAVVFKWRNVNLITGLFFTSVR